MDRDWYDLRLAENFPQDLLEEHYPNLRGVNFIGPWFYPYCAPGIYHWLECPLCNKKCSLHDYEEVYVLHDSIYTDAGEVDKEFLHMVADLGGKLFKNGTEVTREFRVKLV